MVRIPVNAPQPPYPVSPTAPPTNPTGRLDYPSNEPTHLAERNRGVGIRNTTDMPAAAERTGPETSRPDVKNELPSALRVGLDHSKQSTSNAQTSGAVPADLTPRSSWESLRSVTCLPQTQESSTTTSYKETNPYQRTKTSNLDALHSMPNKTENTTAAWADESERVPEPPHSSPFVSPPAPSMPPLDGIPSSQPPFAEPVVDSNISPEERALLPAVGNEIRQAEVQKSTGAWENEQSIQNDGLARPLPAGNMSYTDELLELEAQPFQTPAEAAQQANANENPLQPFTSATGAVLRHGSDPSTTTTLQEKASAPALNDPNDHPEVPPLLPDRPQSHENATPDRGHDAQMRTGTESQQAAVKQQRNETYQIRHVTWFDAASAVNPRRSPIMVQNANGPCPLLALVNALVLSTPADTTTALVDTLRVREQVSLGLLLEAVLDELMSGRRGDAAQNLPDVSDLYAFLINLHTGMNVNPRFVEPLPAPGHLIDSPIDKALHESAELRRPGGFEDTPHMRLYSKFAISLVHGWLPRKAHPVCAALRRSAETYEDAQSLLFAEEDLEHKLQTERLTVEEQRLFEDLANVKQFLTTSPTQLTEYGLDTIVETLHPGAVAILFRNDHFSTLYKQPRSGRIFTLVTDMGYAGHDEVVWESLVDISGEGSEFFSGDFRPVGNNGSNNRQSNERGAAADDAGWTTVSRSGGRGPSRSSRPPNNGTGQNEAAASATGAFSHLSLADDQNMVTPTNAEQEDHDLALALRLQEEEEEHERQEAIARRRREDELSREYLDSASRSNPRGGRPHVPPRGGGGGGGGARRAAPPQRKQTANDDLPPPTYEQAAKGPAYHPPASNVPDRTASRPVRQTSAYSQTNAAFVNGHRPRPAARRQQQVEKERDCVVM
ncbi:MAG: hypothetical protein LQ348_007335 [Seirophora lacunosa]|nr:MAG: hypothetical protein LQ348_007335 [Seirophora lacunosa]